MDFRCLRAGESIGVSSSWSLQGALKEAMSSGCSVEEVLGTEDGMCGRRCLYSMLDVGG